LTEIVKRYIQTEDTMVLVCTLAGWTARETERLCVFWSGDGGHGNRSIVVLLPYTSSKYHTHTCPSAATTATVWDTSLAV